MLASILLSAFVSIASADPTCDHHALLQTKVFPHDAKSKGADQVNELLQSVTHVAKSLDQSSSNAMTPDAVNAAIGTAEGALSSMEEAMTNERTLAQSHINRQFGEIEACHSQATLVLAETNHDAASELFLQCEQQLNILQETQREDCGAWQAAINHLVEIQPARISIETFFQGFNAWDEFITFHRENVHNLRTGCDDATEAVDAKQTECDNKRTDYENAFCEHRLSCGMVSSCQAHELQVYHDLRLDIVGEEQTRENQYNMIQQIQCLLNHIKNAVRTDTSITDAHFSACDPPYGTQDPIQYPTPPEIQTCPAPEDSDPPCPALADMSEIYDWVNGHAMRPRTLTGFLSHRNLEMADNVALTAIVDGETIQLSWIWTLLPDGRTNVQVNSAPMLWEAEGDTVTMTKEAVYQLFRGTVNADGVLEGNFYWYRDGTDRDGNNEPMGSFRLLDWNVA